MKLDMNSDIIQSGLVSGAKGEGIFIHTIWGAWEGLGSSREKSLPKGADMKARDQTQKMLMIQYKINNSNQDLKKHLWITTCNSTLYIN